MSHIHRWQDKETGPAIVGEDGAHTHEIDGEQTTFALDTPDHTHFFEDIETSEPIEIPDNQSEQNQESPYEKSTEIIKELKVVGGRVTDTKIIEKDGIKIGIIQGYIATWDVDRGSDRFVPGAFADSLNDMRERKRDGRFLFMHLGPKIIGKFPIETMKEDERGLFAEGHVNLDVQQAREAYSLAKQGALTDFSVGYSVDRSHNENGITVITRATFWEGSLVDEPMNPEAQVTEIKAVVPFQDLPLASRDRAWDSNAAISRVREATDSEDEPSLRYRRAFLFYDRENENEFGAYKLPIADVIGGRLTAVPRAIFAAAAALSGARGGVDIPDDDRPGVIRNVERYYAKMGLDSPFGREERSFYLSDDLKEMTVRELEKALIKTGSFSKSAAKYLSGLAKNSNNDVDVENNVQENIDNENQVDMIKRQEKRNEIYDELNKLLRLQAG